MQDLAQRLISMGIGILALVYNFLNVKITIMVLILEIVIGSITFIISNGWETSDPNEWLILIEKGIQAQASVGGKCYKKFN